MEASAYYLGRIAFVREITRYLGVYPCSLVRRCVPTHGLMVVMLWNLWLMYPLLDKKTKNLWFDHCDIRVRLYLSYSSLILLEGWIKRKIMRDAGAIIENDPNQNWRSVFRCVRSCLTSEMKFLRKVRCKWTDNRDQAPKVQKGSVQWENQYQTASGLSNSRHDPQRTESSLTCVWDHQVVLIQMIIVLLTSTGVLFALIKPITDDLI